MSAFAYEVAQRVVEIVGDDIYDIGTIPASYSPLPEFTLEDLAGDPVRIVVHDAEMVWTPLARQRIARDIAVDAALLVRLDAYELEMIRSFVDAMTNALWRSSPLMLTDESVPLIRLEILRHRDPEAWRQHRVYVAIVRTVWRWVRNIPRFMT